MKGKIRFIVISIAVAFLIVVGVVLAQEQSTINQQAISMKEFEVKAIHLGSESEMDDEAMSTMMHSFEIAGQYNPTIEVTQGDYVKLKFKNSDKMVLHDLAIPSLGLQTETLSLDEYGEIEFIANTKDELEYLCTLHPDQMSGKIVIKTKNV